MKVLKNLQEIDWNIVYLHFYYSSKDLEEELKEEEEITALFSEIATKHPEDFLIVAWEKGLFDL